MQLVCEDCRTIIQISDDRLPVNATFRIACPRCKRKIVVNTQPSELAKQRESEVVKTLGSTMQDPPASHEPEAFPSATIDTLQPDHHPAALVCVDQGDVCTELKLILKGLGYFVDIPAAPEHALSRLRFNQYEVILLADNLGSKSPNLIGGYLAGLNMSLRRDTFIALIGERFQSGDHWQAFVESVDLVIHSSDLTQLGTLLTRSRNDRERFYSTLNECLVAAGKKM